MGAKQPRILLVRRRSEEKLEKVMIKAFNQIYETAQNRHVDMRLAAYMVGVRKMAEASRFRGWV